MNARSWTARSLLFSLTAASPAAAQYSRTALHRFELPNGLEIVVVENHASPVAMVLVAVRGGATAQAQGEQGLAHLLEHLLFESYGYGGTAFAAAAADLGGRYNGTTHAESAQYHLLLPAERALAGIELLGRLMRMESFNARHLDDERKIVLDELERRQTDPEHVLARRVARDLWGAAWHRRDVAGDSASLMAITKEQLRAAHARYYVPNNALLVVTGAVRAADVFEAAQRHFGPWRRGPDPFAAGAPDSVAPLTGSRAVVLPRAVPDVTIHIGLHGPSLRHDTSATYAADVLLDILNEPRSAFQDRLVGSGLFQRVSVSYSTANGVGPIAFVGKTTPDAAQHALYALIQQIDSLAFLAGASEDDLAIARRQRQVDAALQVEGTATEAPHLAQWWASTGLDYYVSYRERLDAQEPDDLRRFALRYLVGRPKVLGVMGPLESMTRLAESLRGGVTGP